MALLLLLALTGCQDDSAQSSKEPAAVAVEVTPVLFEPLSQWDEFNGRIEAVDAVSIRPRVTGYVERVSFKEGDEVAKGDPLFVIDQRPYRAALESAEARLDRACAAVTLANSRNQRAQTLVKSNTVSVETADTREAERLQSVADVREAEAAVVTAKLNLEFTEVRAPVSGRAGRALLSVGNLARADQSELTSVVSQDPVYVYFNPDEHSFLRYQRQLGAALRDRASAMVGVGLIDETGYPRTGALDYLNNAFDSSTGTVRVRAILPNKDRVLTPGLFARVRMSNGAQTPTMLIDERSVLTDQDRKYVYVLDQGNKAIRKDIVVGRRIDGVQVVTSGLARGDKVVRGGLSRIFYSGVAVSPTEASLGSASKGAGS
ncbi:efflux RND transporter periplasmic adaptor subunit [Hansschlegelia sp. KR7-227]|uniref:efflux RND transporter periplasmic adaptor subunit n=1 Tax=Hansschlegelia sp. KR7-227 TaxID=3400914 RepID=UPI003BFBBB6B